MVWLTSWGVKLKLHLSKYQQDWSNNNNVLLYVLISPKTENIVHLGWGGEWGGGAFRERQADELRGIQGEGGRQMNLGVFREREAGR